MTSPILNNENMMDWGILSTIPHEITIIENSINNRNNLRVIPVDEIILSDTFIADMFALGINSQLSQY